MPPLRLLVPLAAVLTLAPVPAFAEDRTDSVAAFVTQRMADTGVTGASLSIVEGNRVAYEKDFGGTADGDPVGADTPFMWGSVVKPMTAALVLRLAEAGEVELTDPAARYLPGFRPTFDGEAAEPTVAQLLSHTAGLPGIEGADVTDHDGRTDGVSTVAAQLDDIALATEPGTKHAYSSLNYLVAGAVVEAVTNRPFRETLTGEVLRPLGMDSAITDAKTAQRRMPSGNRLWGGMPVAQRTPFDESGLPYGYIGGSRSDLTTFATAALNHDETLLSEKSWRAAQSPQAKTSTGHYGYGWSIREQDGETVLFHTGMTPGYHVNVLLVPQRELAVVLTQNAYAEAWALPLRSTSENVARLWTGREPVNADPDPLLTTTPWVLGSIALLLLLVAGVSAARRSAGPGREEPNGSAPARRRPGRIGWPGRSATARPEVVHPTGQGGAEAAERDADSARPEVDGPSQSATALPEAGHPVRRTEAVSARPGADGPAERRPVPVRPEPGRGRARRRMVLWAVAGVVTPVVVMWLVPLLLGVPLRMLWLFQPDVAAGLSAIAAATVVLAGVRCAKLVGPARRTG